MITKFNYNVDAAGIVKRVIDYTFTPLESLLERLKGITDLNIINGITTSTLRGESERTMIEVEDSWFKLQSKIQDMDAERKTLELKLAKGDSKGNPLKPEQANVISARIADLKEGTVVVKKEFYDHYTRQKMTVDEIHQTPYTIALEARTDAEVKNLYLAGFRGVKTAPARPAIVLDSTKETLIRKLLVRQKIDVPLVMTKILLPIWQTLFQRWLRKQRAKL